MTVINRILVANRGEIARRIFATCRKMGIATVAVFSDADADSPHVTEADEAVRIGPAESAKSYLDISSIIRAATLTKSDAIHPGYGFLSENAAFAEACTAAGITFIGPRADSIRAMGLKREAKKTVAARGVPLVPGFDGGDQSPATLKAKALEIGLPVIFKPSAGGGGKGMKIVRVASELDDAISSGRGEAERAFGDGTLIIEKYLERSRHLEVQVLGDHHGHLVHLFERECSIQRRHQKIIEETPSMALTPETREKLCQAALEAARAVNYTNAGTVEFIMDQSGAFYFSEMNTRLQVEHRVTEMVTGVDLVEQQIRIARGETLQLTQAQISQRGHSIQCRLYAEDPANQFFPSVGSLVDWQAPVTAGVLIDSAVESGSAVSVHYDPMIAKVISHGETRSEAVQKLTRALQRLSAQGVTTNREFLIALLQHEEFTKGNLHTQFIDQHMASTLNATAGVDAVWFSALAATLAGVRVRVSSRSELPGMISGFRNNRSADQFAEFTHGAQSVRVEYRSHDDSRFSININGAPSEVKILEWNAPVLTVQTADGLRSSARVTLRGSDVWVHSRLGSVALKEKARFPEVTKSAVAGGLMSPMPGKVVKVLVVEGQKVTRGQALLVLEAMKMEQKSVAPVDGIVKKISVREGDQVTAGQIMLVME